MKSIEISSAAAKDRRTRPVYRRRWGWRHTLVAVGASVTLCFVLLSVLATTVLRPPRVVGLVAVGAHYAENLHTPHNACGWNGLKAACGLPGKSDSLRIGEDLLLKCQATPTLADDCFAWQDALEQLDETASVLLVSLHGGADEQGAYLLRSGANPSDAPGRRLRVDRLLEDLRSLPKGRLKLVIFDATQVARLGQFSVVQNHFAEGLRLLNDAILSDPSLVVISASSPGERSWIEPALGRTIFLNSLAEGLRGAAHDFDQNGRTSGEELINYLRSVVKSRAESLHRREQNVMVLPAGEEAQRRLARFDLSLVNPDYRPSPDLLPDISPHALKSQSERIEGVAKSLKLPTTVAPIAWRRLRLLQLRHEQLLAAGAPELAEVLAHSIASLAGELEVVAARLAGESDPVQLARAPEGYPLRTAIDPLLAKLVASPADNARSLWAQEDGRINASELESVRRQIYDRLLQRFLDSPVDRLQQTANLIQAISPRSAARPAEAHLLVMLAEGLPHDLDEARWNHPLKVAIQTRLHAEQVYADGDFVEQILSAAIYGWIKLRCDAADQLRREGEDLLFCGEDYLERAEHALEKADALYTKLRSDATELRRAVTVRDQAFSLLSRYSEAVANLVNTSDEDRKELLALRQSVEKAWQSAHTLGDLLAVENVGKDEPHSGIQTVVGLRSQLELTLGGLRMQMQAWTADLIERSGPAFWNNRDATLLAPEIETSQRLRLLSVTPPSAEQAPMDQRGMTLSGSTLSRWRSEEAVRGARLAMAAVGQQRFDQSLHDRQGYAAQMKRLKGESFSDVADRDTALAEVEAGLRTINRVRRRLALQADRLVADGQQDSSGFAVVADAADAERRLSNGADGHEGPHPSGELTKVQLYRFLLARANRAISDGWNCESSGAVPYFRRAAGAYLKRADGLLAGREATDRLKRFARTPVVLNVSSASRVNIVSGIAPPISYSVDASLPGTAAVAVRCANGMRVLNASPSARRAVDIGGIGNNGPEVVVGVDRTGIAVGADAPSNETLRLSFDVWMRGHTATRDTDIVVYHRPDSQMTLPPPNNSAGVTMVTDETVRKALGDAGGVAFVLDASGSMGPADETLASKYVQAVESLNSMLADLPAGVRVSVWVFGQAVGTQKTVENAEATIQQVLSPVEWDPNDQGLRRRLAARIAYPIVEPWNESPLGRAILAAASDLRGVRGYKSIVAITDGMDNRFVTDSVANPLRTSLGDGLARELAGSGISLQVIGFRVTAAEQAAARRQFDFVSSLSPPGRWWEAEQRSDLDEAMRASFHQGQVLLLAPSGAAKAIEPIIANVSGQDKPHDWQSTRLSPGTYTIQPSSSSTDDIASKVLLKGGDLMLLSVKQSGGRPTIVPASYASLCMAGKPAHETSDWRATLIGRRRLPNSALSSLVTLERKWKSPPDEGKILQVIRPKDVWVESLGNTGGGVNWNSLHGYPAPCWELMQTGSSLHGVDSPFTMWWIGDGQCPASLTLRRRRDFSTIGELAGRKLDINGVSVAISRVAVELHALPDPTGALVEQSSLVVELGAPQPFLVDLSGVSVAGRELQLFKEARRCVTRFWPLSDDQLAAALQGIEITAVADLKRIAEIHKQTVTFDELSPASPSEPRPLPAVGWLGASVD